MAVNLKPIAFHTIVANGPWIGSISATIAPNAARYFVGTGAPASGTLSAGNGMYNGQSSGFIVAAVMYAAGSGYSVGDVLTLETGTIASGKSALQLTVDAVNGSGAIVDFHVSTLGSYTAYPDATAGVTGGGGSEAVFMATIPAADFYWDVTTPTNPNLWCCLTGGSNSTSTWFNLTGCPS
jgi:hypothetical protein